MRISRRDLMQAAAVTALTGLSVAKAAAEASGPIRVGLLTVKTGPLASGGIDMERALVMYLKERNNELAGRKIEGREANDIANGGYAPEKVVLLGT